MSDLISRQDAIDALQERYKLYDWDDGGAEKAEVGAIIREIFKLPSAQQWIPCSERLPKDKQRVIIQMYNGYMEIIEFSAVGLTDHLLAWMPLPEPWKGEQNDRHRRSARKRI